MIEVSGLTKRYGNFTAVQDLSLAVRPGEVRLGLATLGHAQVGEPEIRRQVGLDVTAEQRPHPGDVRPLRKPRLPPLVVLWNGVKLRQVERQDFHVRPIPLPEGARLVALAPVD